MNKLFVISNKIIIFFLLILSVIINSCVSANLQLIQKERTKHYRTYLYTSPQKINIERVTAIKSGGMFVVALKNDGTLWSWGYNAGGQLGLGTRVPQENPTQLSLIDNVMAVDTGIFHTLALKKDGTLWAWGYNDKGQLGLGHRRYETIPEQVYGLSKVTSIFAGYKTSFAIQEDGSVWAWGNNNRGQLGIGNTEDQGRPKLIRMFDGVRITKIVPGNGFAFALDSSGQVWAWGTGDSGELGISQVDYLEEPQRVNGLNDISNLYTRFKHVVAIRRNGTTWTWGRNQEGQLGIGTYFFFQDTPQQIEIPQRFKFLATGYTSTFAVDNNNKIWTWGLNNKKQLGYTDKEETNEPRLIDSIDNIIEISTGFAHVIALKADGTVWMWGQDHGGYIIPPK